jgi:hypothetical protein
MNFAKRLWNDDLGFVISAELVLVATIMVIGLIVGMATVRDQVVQELGDVADTIGSINQTYSYSGVEGHSSSTAGSERLDLLDMCDNIDNLDNDSDEPGCIEINDIFASPEG